MFVKKKKSLIWQETEKKQNFFDQSAASMCL